MFIKISVLLRYRFSDCKTLPVKLWVTIIYLLNTVHALVLILIHHHHTEITGICSPVGPLNNC